MIFPPDGGAVVGVSARFNIQRIVWDGTYQHFLCRFAVSRDQEQISRPDVNCVIITEIIFIVVRTENSKTVGKTAVRHHLPELFLHCRLAFLQIGTVSGQQITRHHLRDGVMHEIQIPFFLLQPFTECLFASLKIVHDYFFILTEPFRAYLFREIGGVLEFGKRKCQNMICP